MNSKTELEPRSGKPTHVQRLRVLAVFALIAFGATLVSWVVATHPSLPRRAASPACRAITDDADSALLNRAAICSRPRCFHRIARRLSESLGHSCAGNDERAARERLSDVENRLHGVAAIHATSAAAMFFFPPDNVCAARLAVLAVFTDPFSNDVLSSSKRILSQVLPIRTIVSEPLDPGFGDAVRSRLRTDWVTEYHFSGRPFHAALLSTISAPDAEHRLSCMEE